NRHIAPFDVTGFIQALPERNQTGSIGLERPAAEKPDHRHRLRARRNRPCRSATNQRYQVAAPHSMTSSAMASIDGGMATPRVLAVLRLMINSIFVDCCTGRSAGLSPFRIRLTYTPT